jgi:hypothetical protein
LRPFSDLLEEPLEEEKAADEKLVVASVARLLATVVGKCTQW